jgi:hypothetical protein
MAPRGAFFCDFYLVGIINSMPNHESIEQHLYDLILDVCAVLYANGYRTVPMGAMMRLIGVADEHAAEHDNNVFELDDEFAQVLQQRQHQLISSTEQLPPNTTLH